MERRLLITGMGGVIGRQVALVGLEQGFKVFGTVRNSIPSELARLGHQGEIAILRADLRQQEQTERVISIARPDVVINLAGHSENIPNFGRTVFDENMAILRNLLSSALSFEKGSERFRHPITFVQAGTIWEYGQVLGEIPLTEIPYDRLPIPQDSNYYAQSKIAAEGLLLASYQTDADLKPILLRLAHHTGEGKETGITAVGAEAVLKVKNGEDDIIRIRNKLGRVDLSYSGDAARAIILLSQQGIPGEAYNIARGQDYSIEEILRIMASRLNLSPSVGIVSTGEEYVTHGRFNVQKLLSLGFQPYLSLSQIIVRFIDWYCQKGEDGGNLVVGQNISLVAPRYPRQSAIA